MRPTPNVSHLRFNFGLFLEDQIQQLEPDVFKAVALLYARSASGQVWTYEAPNNGALRNDDKWLAAFAGTTPAKWKRIKKDVLKYFNVRDGSVFPANPEWIEIVYGMARPAIPASVRSLVMHRDQFTCVYCGDQNGPFDLDHVVPIAQGGDPVSPDNLLCACASCNRSKGALTPAQWIGGEK